jgi:methyl-accepting chemotaxis protein
VTDQQNSIEIAVSIGRIEEMVKSLFSTAKEQAVSMRDLDLRVRELEQIVQQILANQKPVTPWYSTVGAVVGIITGIGSLIALLSILGNLK